MKLNIELSENSCVIVPHVLKKTLNEMVSNQKLANVKVCTFDEIEQYLSFSFTKDALYFLTTTCHISIPVAKMIMEELYYIEDKEYHETSLDKLVVYYRILKEYKKITWNHYGESFLTRFPIKVIGFDYFTKKETYYLEKLKTLTEVEIISIPVTPRTSFEVYKYEHIRDEVEGVALRIAKLLEEGITPERIHLIGFTEDYMIQGQRIFPYYQLPFDLSFGTTLYTTTIGLSFLSLLKTEERMDIVDSLKKKYGKTKEEVGLINDCIDILNNYAWYEGPIKDLYDYILADVQEKQVSLKKLGTAINQTTLLHNYFSDEDYVFIVGANQGEFPTIMKDEDYITDGIAHKTLKDDTVYMNTMTKQGYIQALSRISNLYISYKEKTDDMIYYPASILNEMNFEVKEGTLDFSHNYSHQYQKIHMARFLDDLKNYNTYHEPLSLLAKTYDIHDYLSYNHRFQGLKEVSYRPRLSYTSMSTYFECGFKYYLTYLLSLSEFEETFAQKVGNIYHYILSIWDHDLDEIKQELIKQEQEVSFGADEQVWWESLRTHLFYLLEVLKEQKLCTDFNKEYHEQEVLARVKERPEITLKGIIDKIMVYEENGKRYAALVDYKTGSLEISMKYLKYGFDMQLPFYLYLMKENEDLMEHQVVGLYLQKCLNYKLSTKHDEHIESLKKDSLRLEGYSTSNQHILCHLDKTYENSLWIKGMKTTKNGFSRYAKLVSEKEIEEVLKQMEQNIIFAYDHITTGDFSINPKVIDQKNKSCSFCPFQDICFKTNNDTVYLGGKEDE